MTHRHFAIFRTRVKPYRAYNSSVLTITKFGSGRHLVTVTMKSKLPAARFAVYVRMCLRGVRILPG